MTNYQQAKEELKRIANHVKKHYPSDKPLQRQCINDNAYFLSCNLTEHEKNLLDNYACKLHPKF